MKWKFRANVDRLIKEEILTDNIVETLRTNVKNFREQRFYNIVRVCIIEFFLSQEPYSNFPVGQSFPRNKTHYFVETYNTTTSYEMFMFKFIGMTGVGEDDMDPLFGGVNLIKKIINYPEYIIKFKKNANK